MRVADRILATCSVAALAALCTVALGTSDAQAARPQGHDARRDARPAAHAAPVPHAALPTPGPGLRAAYQHAGKHRVSAPSSKSGNIKTSKLRVAGSQMASQSWGAISCVPFARAATGLDVKGNAHAWWASAAGTYERGQRPEAGSVLNFRSTARMRLGHVAVVARVIDSRTIEIDHANWGGPAGGKGRVSRGVPVIDVSDANDWSAVQVALPGGGFGSVYPTYGFIYDRPDTGVMVANTLSRPGSQGRYSEVAEAWTTRVLPAGAVLGTGIDAPQRSLR